MEDTRRTNRSYLDTYRDPPVLRYTTDYFIRLLVQRHAIRSALLSPGGSVILTGTAATTEASPDSFSSVIGNDLHLDLLEAEAIVQRLPKGQQIALMQWIDGMNSTEAAHFSSVKPRAIRKRRQVALEHAERLWKARHNEEDKSAEHSA